MLLKGFLFLAAYTSRSRAYAQVLRHNDLEPESVLLFGDPAADGPMRIPVDRKAAAATGLFFPDLSETVGETCDKAGWTTTRVDRDDVNHPDVVEAVRAARPRYVIYSGYPGQMVKPRHFEAGIPYLHMHSGWLPEYGGSTSLYYCWLKENRAAVTAFILDAEIDAGPIVARHRYPAPAGGMEVDHLYDGAIRADTLARVLKGFIETGAFLTIPRERETEIYFVIHPVLKHLALLSRAAAD